jgi:hypothetical protein
MQTAGAVGSDAVGSGELGLSARLDIAMGALADVVCELDPDCMTGSDASELYGSFAGMERLSVAGKTLLAARIEASGIWRETGHRNAAALLAQVEGVSTGHATATLAIGRQLDELPATKEAVRSGTLSSPKVAELVGAGALDPSSESELLAGAADEPLRATKERCRRSRATSGAIDPLATIRRIREARHFSSWIDPEGAFCFQGRDTADRGALILSHLSSVAARLRRTGKASEGDPQPERALLADALFSLVTQRHPDVGAPPDTSSPPGTGAAQAAGTEPRATPPSYLTSSFEAESDPDCDPETLGMAAEEGSVDPDPSLDSRSIIDRPPSCSVVVRVDLDALLRGHAEPGECCEIDNLGPIPVPMARDMANDSFLRFVFHRAGDIRAVSHFGRTINRQLRTALVHRDTTCVVPRCGVSFGLEIDHIVPLTEGGPTELGNLALLCHHHHFLKTFEGWHLERIGTEGCGKPQWRFEPQAPFGQEPGLGIDTTEGQDRWRRQQE